MVRRAARWVVAASFIGLIAPAWARAQECVPLPDPVAGAHGWAKPLARPVRLHANGLDLRRAIEQIAASAALRLSYSEDLLPAGRRVCASWDSVAAGDALVRLLEGVALEPVVAGGNLVVLAPVRRPEPQPAPAKPKEEPPVVALEPMVVTAAMREITSRSQAFTSQVIDRNDPGFTSASTMASLLSGTVPGLWMWESPTSAIAQYGSLRGASSFGLTSPKIYIDGIEVANPLLLNRLSPDAIDRIEVIRGPQGSALYGANAIGGVTNIITRHPSLGGGAPRARLSTGFGLGSSNYVNGGALEQNHSLGIVAGSAAKSAYVDLSLGTMGAYVPDAFSRHFSANGSARLVGSRSLITGTLRLFAQEAGSPSSPILDSIAPTNAVPGVATGSDNLSLRQYTLGVQATIAGSPHWTHSFVAGFDGYTLDGVPSGRTPWLSPTDSALRAAGTNGIRGTFRASSMARLFTDATRSASVTLAAEHSVLRQRGGFEVGFKEGGEESEANHDGPGRAGYEYVASAAATEVAGTLLQRTNTGVSARLDGGWRDRFFFTGGIRVEHDGGASLSSRIATLPTVGAAWAAGTGPLSLKLRASWGKGIRWPQLPTRLDEKYGAHLQMMQPDLAPEVQSGIEAGIDVAWKRTFSLQLTRFDQTATGVIQQIGLADSARLAAGWMHYRGVQGNGSIANRGWELQASARRGPLAVSGSLSLVDSRVSALSGDYAGDLIQGDRMLAVPAKTIGLTTSWTAPRWSTSLSAWRAADWINYDRIALARALSTGPAPSLEPLQLRDYWREYSGNTHLRATFTRELRTGMTLLFTGDNLLDLQVGEPDNITVVPGRTFSLGLRAAFF
jgi:iron complex outermembrane receptor protein